jgi:hypothetical protein
MYLTDGSDVSLGAMSAEILRESMLHCAEEWVTCCNGRPHNVLILLQSAFQVRTENHGVGGSIPPLGTTSQNLSTQARPKATASSVGPRRPE